MLPVRVELLGKLRFLYGQQVLSSIGTNRLQSLLAYLVLHPGVPQSREQLAALLWPESNESQARTNLRQLLHHLRRALPSECSLLETDNHTALWRADRGCSTDVAEFEAEATRATEAESRGDAATARQALEQAAKLYADDLLPDLYDEWLQPRREQLRLLYADVLSRLASLLEAAGEHPSAIRHATRLVAVDPLRETSYQLLMRLHLLDGDRSSALRVYHQCMKTLKRELGIAPAKGTQELFSQALKTEESRGPAPAPSRTSAAEPLPIVGRAAEWARLLACWEEAATAASAHFALILGEPGVGKSRLAEELFRHCSHDSSVARARCYFAQGRIAYGPVAEWLGAPAMQDARARLHRPQLAELARVLPEILVQNPDLPAPPPLTESWQKRHLHEALNAAFADSPKPLLLFVDDLQWCDNDTFEWLHAFLRSPASAKTLVLGTARAEEVGRDHPAAVLANEMRESGHLSEFALAPLGSEDAAALAAQVAGRECDPAFLGRLYQSTKGNPLFVVESVRASLEKGPGGSLASPRVQAVIGARLAQLSPAAYELAGIAATIGRSFSLELLAKVTDWDEAGLSVALEELWQRRIIDAQGPGTAAYDYTHDLLREVAYSELSPIRRRSYHRRVARALEDLHAAELDGISGSLAAHYEAAGMAEQAIRYYRTAADFAKRRFADADAADQTRRALRLCAEFPESAARDRTEIELLATLGPALVTTQGYSTRDVGETYERGLLLAKRSGDGKHRFSLISGAWLFNTVRANLEESRRLGQECIDSADGSDALDRAGRFLLGTTLFHLGRLGESRESVVRASPKSGHASDPALALFAGPDFGVFCRAYLGHVYWLLGDGDRSEASMSEAIEIARDLRHPFSLAGALDYAAMLSVFRVEPDRALAHAEESAAVCRKYGIAYYLAWAEMVAGWAIAAGGDPAAGLGRFRSGLDAFRAVRAELRLPFYYALLADIQRLAGRHGDALASVSSGFAFQSKNGEMWFAPELHRIHGDLLGTAGNVAEARASYGRAMEAARETGAGMLEARAAARLAGLQAVRKAPER